MSTLSIKKGTALTTTKVPIKDGQLLFETDTKKIWLDDKTVRLQMGGTDTIAWNNITSKPSYYDAKAITSINRSGTTFTATHLDGTTSTFTQQDNNTTYTFATGSANGTIAVNGTDIAVKGLGSNAYNSTAYLPLTGGILKGTLYVEGGNVQADQVWGASASGETTIGVLNTTPNQLLYLYSRPDALGLYCHIENVMGRNIISIDPTNTSVTFYGAATQANILGTPDNGAVVGMNNGAAILTLQKTGGITNWAIERHGTGEQLSAHFYNTTDGSWVSNHILLDHFNYQYYALPLSGGTLTGHTTISYAHTGGGMLRLLSTGENEASMSFDSGSTQYWVVGKGCGGTGNGTFAWWYNPNAKNVATLTSAGVFTASQVYGAVWNDYAEYRQAEIIEPGRVVREDTSGVMKLATERLMSACEIISDTFGFAIGETDECKTPIACTGRVLAYTDNNRDTFNIGDAVCSGVNGTVSVMTREEIREYPDRIIGYVSEIPTYETWGTGNVKVDGRIWIRVR